MLNHMVMEYWTYGEHWEGFGMPRNIFFFSRWSAAAVWSRRGHAGGQDSQLQQDRPAEVPARHVPARHVQQLAGGITDHWWLTASCWRNSGMQQLERYRMAPSDAPSGPSGPQPWLWSSHGAGPSRGPKTGCSRPPLSPTSPTESARGSEGSLSCWGPRSAYCACTGVVRSSATYPLLRPAWTSSWCSQWRWIATWGQLLRRPPHRRPSTCGSLAQSRRPLWRGSSQGQRKGRPTGEVPRARDTPRGTLGAADIINSGILAPFPNIFFFLLWSKFNFLLFLLNLLAFNDCLWIICIRECLWVHKGP